MLDYKKCFEIACEYLSDLSYELDGETVKSRSYWQRNIIDDAGKSEVTSRYKGKLDRGWYLITTRAGDSYLTYFNVKQIAQFNKDYFERGYEGWEYIELAFIDQFDDIREVFPKELLLNNADELERG